MFPEWANSRLFAHCSCRSPQSWRPSQTRRARLRPVDRALETSPTSARPDGRPKITAMTSN
eukprot:8899764-Alexandrium_andersonii.AAC.1